VSAGTSPGAEVHPVVVEAMRERGIELAGVRPRLLTPELAQDVTWLITMGCGDQCPVVPGVRRDDWPLDDPKGQPIEEVRRIRDEIERRVKALAGEQGWSR
jgi:arsenate reductase